MVTSSGKRIREIEEFERPVSISLLRAIHELAWVVGHRMNAMPARLQALANRGARISFSVVMPNSHPRSRTYSAAAANLGEYFSAFFAKSLVCLTSVSNGRRTWPVTGSAQKPLYTPAGQVCSPSEYLERGW